MRVRTLLTVALTCLALLQPVAFALPSDKGAPAARLKLGQSATQVSVRAESKAALRELEAEVKRTGGRIDRRSGDGAALLVTVPSGTDSAAYAEVLAEAAPVAFAEPVGLITASAVPNDPLYPQQWGLPAIGAPAAWDYTWGAESVLVAVIDSGVDLEHPDLAGRIAPGGWDFIGNDGLPDDVQGHGTFIAGIVAAQTNNNLLMAGTAPGARILPVRVLNDTGNGNTFVVAQGVRWAVDAGAKVINMSLGGPISDSELTAALQYAQSKDVVIVAASGNTHPAPVQSPAREPGVIAVGSVDKNSVIADSSCRGPELDLVAPGVGIQSVMNGSTWGTGSGTSMAAPFVAGAAALLRSAAPHLSAAEVAATLSAHARDLGATGRDDTFGAGIVDIGRAMASTDLAPTTTLSVSSAPNLSGWYKAAPTITLAANEPGTTYYTWGSGPQQTYSAPIAPPEGRSTLTYWSRDVGGRTELPKTASFAVDTVKPAQPAGLSATPVGGTGVRISWAAAADVGSGVASYLVRNTTSGVVRFTSATSVEFTGLAYGTAYTFTVTATDAAGNTSTAAPVAHTTPAPPVLDSVYRFYNRSNGTHFFTPSVAERDTVIARWPNVFTYEGVAYQVNQANTQPLYRFYNTRSGSHFYTASLDEANTVMQRWSHVFAFEGQTYAVALTGAADDAVYRFYNARNGSHFYTSSAQERDEVIARYSATYSYEGPVFYLGR